MLTTRMSSTGSNPVLALVVTSATRLLAIPAASVRSVGDPPRSPAPPAAAPWLAGLVLDGGPGILIAPFGPSQDDTTSVALATNLNTPLAIAVAAVGGLVQAQPLPGAGRSSHACPAAWLGACRLADGREATLLDVTALGTDLDQA